MAHDGPYRRSAPGSQPAYLHEPYGSTRKRAPLKPLVAAPQLAGELAGPAFAASDLGPAHDDLTAHGKGPVLGERIIVSGRVLDEDGRPAANTLVEVWQANAAGRYAHRGDQHDAPLDPNFSGEGRVMTDAEGRYRFVTVKPGAYPWGNHPNAWRPAHIHFSVFGPSVLTRLVTQMYFPGDPLLEIDPIYNSTPDPSARKRLIAAFDLGLTKPDWALGYRFDIVLRGRDATPRER
ncbi:protocatechuate 3,4-dioxygenase subunit beta [Betaproteobacteria bacterium GR16-43]|nr:protocatechuate 3,4-dioxygenase subunit beta [Betaproteobacteria bacterium GR16-43]